MPENPDATDRALAELAASLRRIKTAGIALALALAATGAGIAFALYKNTDLGSGTYVSGGVVGMGAGVYVGIGIIAGLALGWLALRMLLRARGRALVRALAARQGVSEEDLRAQLTLF